MKMGINHWPEGERPREKLLTLGAQALSDAELLAIFLRVGVKGRSAVDLARDLLVSFGGLRPLMESEQRDFCAAKGLGSAKYAQLQATLELSRRHLASQLARGEALTSPALVRHYLSSQLRHLGHEEFAVLFLDTQHRIIRYESLFRGTLNSASVYPRDVAKRALELGASLIHQRT